MARKRRMIVEGNKRVKTIATASASGGGTYTAQIVRNDGKRVSQTKLDSRAEMEAWVRTNCRHNFVEVQNDRTCVARRYVNVQGDPVVISEWKSNPAADPASDVKA